MDEEDIIDPLNFVESLDIEFESGESDDDIHNIEENIIENIEDINVFNKNYNNLKKKNKSSQILSKYEKTKILSKRCEQLESGCLPLIKDYSKYDNIYDIALEELNEKKEIQTHNEKVELDYLTKKFGADEANKIREGKIWQGMTKDMLLHSKDSYHHPGGEPGDIEETIYKTKTKANYFYDSYTTSHNNIKYKLDSLNYTIAKKDFWQDKKKVKKTVKEKKHFETVIESFNILKQDLENLKDIYSLAKEESEEEIILDEDDGDQAGSPQPLFIIIIIFQQYTLAKRAVLRTAIAFLLEMGLMTACGQQIAGGVSNLISFLSKI